MRYSRIFCNIYEMLCNFPSQRVPIWGYRKFALLFYNFLIHNSLQVYEMTHLRSISGVLICNYDRKLGKKGRGNKPNKIYELLRKLNHWTLLRVRHFLFELLNKFGPFFWITKNKCFNFELNLRKIYKVP